MRMVIATLGIIGGLLAGTFVYMMPTIIAGAGHSPNSGVLLLLWLVGAVVGPIIAVRRWNLRHRVRAHSES